MTTQYTPILKLALPVQGELSGTWGDVVNDNITSMIEQAIAGRLVINTWSSNSHTLTTANGTTAESRAAMLSLTDSGSQLSAAGTVVCPALSKTYIVKNGAGQIVTVKTPSGSGIAVPNGKTMLVYCDGTNVLEGVDHIVTLSAGTLTIGTGATVSTVLDEDNMASNSATALVTQQSVKAYVDGQTTPTNSVTTAMIQDNAITTAKIAADAVTQAKIADDAVGADQLAANAVVTASITDDAVTQAKIADDAVGADQLAANAVVTASITDDAVTQAKIADDAVVTAAIANDAVTQAKIADNAVGADQLVANAITTAKIAADAVTQAKIADDAVGADQLAANAVVTASIADNAITTVKIADSAIATAKMADNAVTAVKIASVPITVGITAAVSASSLTVTANTLVYVSAAGRTVTLPASPSIGQRVIITVGNFTDTIVGRNGSKIMSLEADFTMDSAYLSIQFIYTDSTQGWVMT